MFVSEEWVLSVFSVCQCDREREPLDAGAVASVLERVEGMLKDKYVWAPF